MNKRQRAVAAAVFVAGCAACTNGPDKGDEASVQRAAPSATSPTSPTSSTELTGDALAAFEHGLKQEIQAVRAAQERSRTAKTPQERGEASQAAFEGATIPLGAKAAGLPVERYRTIREQVARILQTLDFQGKIEGPQSIDLSRADAATKERLARDPMESLSPASAAALKGRMNSLVPIWIEYVSLTAVSG